MLKAEIDRPGQPTQAPRLPGAPKRPGLRARLAALMPSRAFGLVALGLLIVFGGIAAWKVFGMIQGMRMMAQMKPPAMTVAATSVEAMHWEPRTEAVGQLVAVEGARITAEVPGKIVAIAFESGRAVEKDAVLLELDATAEQAELRALQAELEIKNLDFKRAEALARTSAASRAQLDRAKSELERLQAKVDEQTALVAKKSIRAPFSGELGIRQLSIGAYVSPGAEIVTLSRLDPIYVNFSLPEKELSRLAVGQTVELAAAAFPGTLFKGAVTAISPDVDEATRTVRAQATLANPDRRLRPGMFVSLSLIGSGGEDVLTVPRTAITYFPYGEIVFAIKGEGDDLTVERRPIEAGRIRANRVEILKGLVAGERIVNTGQHKLRDGQRVRVDNSVVLPQEVDTP